MLQSDCDLIHSFTQYKREPTHIQKNQQNQHHIESICCYLLMSSLVYFIYTPGHITELLWVQVSPPKHSFATAMGLLSPDKYTARPILVLVQHGQQ